MSESDEIKEKLKKSGVNVGGDIINEGEMTVRGEKMPRTDKPELTKEELL